MKIIEIIPQLTAGGAERFVVNLSNQFCLDNHDVKIVVLGSIKQEDFLYNEISHNIEVISLNKKRGFDLFLLIKLLKFIRKEKPDIVHTHLRSLLYLGITPIFIKKIKYFHTVHSDPFVEKSDVFSSFLRFVLFKFKLVYPITISKEMEKDFYSLYGISSRIVYNGTTSYRQSQSDISKVIATELYDIKYNKDSLLLINVARLAYPKNQFVLAKAINALNKKGFSVELVIIGPISDENVSLDIKELNSPYVHYLGVKTNPRDYIVHADGFCLASIYEGVPISLLEALSVGAFVICTPVGGIPNIISDNKNGFLAKSCQQEDLEEVITRFVLTSTVQKNIIKDNARKSFTEYSIEECADCYIKNFKEMM